MRTKSSGGFTLIELLIVIAIIGILAAVLIPNLLNARARAFDSAAQTCLREISTQFEVVASNAPFTYRDNATGMAIATTAAAPGGATINAVAVNACQRVRTDHEISDGAAAGAHYVVIGRHVDGTTTYVIRNGRGVVPVANDADVALPTGAPALPTTF